MAGVRGRVYLADSKISVRRKLGLEENQNDEDFVKFESICSNVYHFKISFDAKVNWSTLDGASVTAAESMIIVSCRKEKLKLGDSEIVLRELIEWKLYQVHRAAQKKTERQGKHSSSGTYSRSVSKANADPYPLDVGRSHEGNQSSAPSLGPSVEPSAQSKS